ncbi:hypothetical protein EV183_004980 [Coemansia sp. RSA 2336]|nr:hypothetical protein EV183_004980 [Coemansia sp. RSA 2336]
MHIDSLPVEILDRIFRSLVVKRRINYHQWKEALVLLGVSRLWRAVAMPLVHSWAIVECVEDYVVEDDSASVDDADELWLTNFSFFELYPWPVHVRKVHFYHEAPIPAYSFLTRAAPIPAYSFLTRAVGLICSHSKHLERVDGVEFSFLTLTSLEVNELGPVKETMVYNLSMQLVNAMPRLTRVETLTRHVQKDDKVMFEFLTNIVERLAHQLKACHLYFPLKLQNIKFSENLECMALYLHTNNLEGVPKMDVSTLKNLCFDNMEEHFPWHLFQNPLTPDFIIFNNLQSLYLRCDRRPDAPDNSLSKLSYSDLVRFPKFRFPNLVSVGLELCYDSHLYILRDWKATHLKFLHLTGTIRHLNMFPFKQLECVDTVSLFVTQVGPKHEDMFYSVTNHMFSKVASFSSNLTLHTVDFSLDLSRINWPNLTKLTLPEVTELSTVIAIIERLPKLEALDLCRLAFTGYPIGDCESSAWKNMVATPIKTKLKELDLYHSFAETKASFAAAVALYFVVCMESLQKLFVDDPVRDQMACKLDQLKCEYSHISNVKIYTAIM